jgi:superfamily II DNA or RNA helicase
MGKKANRVSSKSWPSGDCGRAVLLATSGLIGKGLDCPTLDSVFLAFPIKFRGSIVQHVARILRPIPGKTQLIVHDYVDTQVLLLARHYQERVRGYANLGFPAP